MAQGNVLSAKIPGLGPVFLFGIFTCFELEYNTNHECGDEYDGEIGLMLERQLENAIFCDKFCSG